jgi:hypothetical protein
MKLPYKIIFVLDHLPVNYRGNRIALCSSKNMYGNTHSLALRSLCGDGTNSSFSLLTLCTQYLNCLSLAKCKKRKAVAPSSSSSSQSPSHHTISDKIRILLWLVADTRILISWSMGYPHLSREYKCSANIVNQRKYQQWFVNSIVQPWSCEDTSTEISILLPNICAWKTLKELITTVTKGVQLTGI